jgi:hypothetical protein
MIEMLHVEENKTDRLINEHQSKNELSVILTQCIRL